MPLPSAAPDPALIQIAERAVEFYEAGHGATVPCWVYVYDPAEEFAVRREVLDVATWLRAPGRMVEPVSVSLADVFWEAIDASMMYDELVEQERDAADDPAAQAVAHRAVGQILRLPPTLTERVAQRLRAADGRRLAVLYRAGALYPGYRTSALLDDLKLRTGVRVPLLLLYPGTIEGGYGLRFMGKTDAAYGYRAMIVARGEKRNPS